MTALVEQLYHNNTKERPKVHPLIKPKAVDPREDESSKRRYINRYFILGWLQLILGLTRANEPWKNLFNFKKIISVAFATRNLCFYLLYAMGVKCSIFNLKIYCLNDYFYIGYGRMVIIRTSII